jgi:hypothetical protein
MDGGFFHAFFDNPEAYHHYDEEDPGKKAQITKDALFESLHHPLFDFRGQSPRIIAQNLPALRAHHQQIVLHFESAIRTDSGHLIFLAAACLRLSFMPL